MQSSAAQSSASPIARLDGVTKSFGDTAALRGISLQVPAGIVGLLGPNGAGKSTLMRLLLGLEHADNGSVELLGWPLPEASVQARAEIGFMPEDDSLFPGLNGIEQVVHAAKLCGLGHTDAFARAHEILDLVGLSEARYRAASGFSLGMRQRLRLAMALVHGPKMVLLDEPTAGLDPAGRAEMLGLIAEVGRAGTAVILSTHVLGDVEEVCDHVVLLSRGKLGFVGPTTRFRAGAGHRSAPARSTGTDHTSTAGHHLVDVVGDAAALATHLREQGLAVDVDGDRLRMSLSADQTQLLWQAAMSLGVGIRTFKPQQEGMAEAFVRHLRLDDPTRRAGGSAS
ncbi:MAG: ABC transporter ATP-binding protein [Myxococcales bacterium]|nr:ABC transporter ATP-binding protein [Myxococcales bacterium]